MVARDRAARVSGEAGAGWTGWAGLVVLLVIFSVLAADRVWFNDDVFITFRYAEHLAEGHGFVWNPGGAPVEGSTSLAWTFLNAAAIGLGIGPMAFSQTLGVLAGIAGLVLVYLAGRVWLRLPPVWALVGPALLVAHRQYVFWAGCGLETRAATVAGFAGLLVMAWETRRDPPGWRASGLVFLLGTLFRPEMPLIHLGAGAGLWLAKPSRSRFRAVALSGAVHGVGLCLLIGARLVYFGKALPNTFYAKVGGFQIGRGLEFAGQFLLQYYGWLWGPLLVAGLVVLLGRAAAGRRALVLLGPVCVLGGWIITSGGGRWEFRFFDPLLPCGAVLIAASLYALWTALPRSRVIRAAGVVVVGAVVLSQALTLTQSFRQYGTMMSVEQLYRAAREMELEGRILAPYLTPESRIAIGWAGAVPYVTGAWHFDPWGLNEPAVDTWPFDEKAVLFHQRHASWDDIVAADVMFADVFNAFLWPRPRTPGQISHLVRPWAREGILIHCVEIPGQQRLPFWIFASPRPQEEVRAWARGRDLRVRYSLPLMRIPDRTVDRPGPTP
jgi:hypothetical protein